MLNFETKHTEAGTKDINVINKMDPMEDQTLTIQLQQALDQMTKRLEAFEIRMQPTGVDQTVCDRNPPIADHNRRPRWKCGVFGHFQCDCFQLNYNGPARSVGSWLNLYPPT